MTLQQVCCRVKPYEASFFPATVIPWNRLPASAVTASLFQGQDDGSCLLVAVCIVFLSTFICNSAQRLYDFTVSIP